ncbi:protein XRP2-like [Sycon ciliatum]|uniref:protein XRP2-like n=1 Tax=Sycon ciliatum TaxID=27933 RepID=UPI0031F691DB
MGNAISRIFGRSSAPADSAATRSHTPAATEPSAGSASSGGGSGGSAEATGKKVYSWDKRRQEGSVNTAHYEVKDLQNGFVAKMPGDVSGQSFNISRCSDSTILVFDQCASVTIDECTDCTILIGPTNGSIFLRDCKRLNCAMVCKQFRARDCKRVTTLLCCTSNPTLEASKHMAFGCLSLSYKQLADQLASAGIVVFDNSWFDVFDFSRDNLEPGEQWKFQPTVVGKEDSVLKLHKIVDDHAELASLEITTSVESSQVPFTVGYETGCDYDQSSLAVFCNADQEDVAAMMRRFTTSVAMDTKAIQALRSRRTTLTQEDCKEVFSYASGDKQTTLAKQGPIVGVQLSGEDITQEWFSAHLAKSTTSTDQPAAFFFNHQDAGTKFFDFASMMSTR